MRPVAAAGRLLVTRSPRVPPAHGAHGANHLGHDLPPAFRTEAERAHAEATRRSIHWIEVTEAYVEALPFDEGTFELCVTYTGLHCFPDPAAAIAEMARTLRPGGELRGTTIVKGAGLRHDAVVRFKQLAGVFGPSGTLSEFKSWLATAGIVSS